MKAYEFDDVPELITDRDGSGRCLDCRANLQEGEPHLLTCQLAHRPEPSIHIEVTVDASAMAREIAEAIANLPPEAPRRKRQSIGC